MNDCVFCDLSNPNTAPRIIRKSEYSFSLVPKHNFRDDHTLVIPLRHVAEVSELSTNESVEIMAEIGRLAKKVDHGFGSGVMQKYQPLQAENGIKVNHLHFHVFPRVENEEILFPVPEPNSFDGMRLVVSPEKIVEELK